MRPFPCAGASCPAAMGMRRERFGQCSDSSTRDFPTGMRRSVRQDGHGLLLTRGLAMKCNLILWAALLLVVAPAGAGELYRCVGPFRQVSYQSAACADGHRTDRTITFAAKLSQPAAVTSPSRRESRLERSRVASPNSHDWHVARRSSADTCTRARAARKQTLERLGLSRTYDQLSRIDAKVRGACKGY